MGQRLTIQRQGDFVIKTRGNHHCGTSSTLEMHYTLTVLADANSTDQRGFLFDQLRVQDYFESLGSTRLSCEKLCQRSCHDLVQQIIRENPVIKIHHIKLALGPSHAAWMHYECDGEDLQKLCETCHMVRNSRLDRPQSKRIVQAPVGSTRKHSPRKQQAA
jgi:hypothetical protein